MEGFEPTALGFGDRCSNQTELHSYEPEPEVLSRASPPAQVGAGTAQIKRAPDACGQAAARIRFWASIERTVVPVTGREKI